MIALSALAAFVVGYLLGSIPFGLLITRLAGAGDVREIGSGNIGATNVLRTGRRGLAAATLALDALKGAVAVIVAVLGWQALAPNPGLVTDAVRASVASAGLWAAGGAAVGAMVGHCFPVWLRFKGGKGVATFLGILLVLFWVGALAFAVIWLACAYFTRLSSLSALVAVATAPVIALVLGSPFTALVLALMGVIVFYRHRENIARLRAGTESRIGGSKPPTKPSSKPAA